LVILQLDVVKKSLFTTKTRSRRPENIRAGD